MTPTEHPPTDAEIIAVSYFPRRLSSDSTAWRMKAATLFSPATALMRLSKEVGIRVRTELCGTGSATFGRPRARFPGSDFSLTELFIRYQTIATL